MNYLRVLLLSLLAVSVGWAEEVRTLSGKTIKGQVVDLTPQSVRVQDEGGKVEEIPLTQVLAIDFQTAKGVPQGEKAVLLQLFDDSELYCRDVQFAGEKVQATLLSGQKATLPLNSLVGFLRDAQDEKIRQQWHELRKRAVKKDRILVLREGELNPLEGVLGDVDVQGERIQFRRDDKILPVRLDKLHGMIFQRTNAPTQSPVCLVYDTTGTVLAATTVAIKNKEFLVTTSTGAQVTFTEANLAKLDYNRGKLTYLSDLEPADILERSNIGLIVRYHKDRNLDGEPILLGKQDYDKGLSMHAHTELEYDLGGKYKNFQAVLGFDPRTGASKATVTVLADGLQIFQQPVEAQPRPLALNIRDVNKLRIIVSASNPLDLHDHATLAAARVSQ